MADSYLLKEDTYYLLLESTGKIIITKESYSHKYDEKVGSYSRKYLEVD